MEQAQAESQPDPHLPLLTLAKWIAGSLEHDEVRRTVIPHLLATCEVCRGRHAEIERLKEEVGHWDEEVAVVESRLAPELWALLADRPFTEQVAEIAGNEDLHLWALCQLLLQKSREATFHDPGRAVALSNLALRVVRHLGEAYDPHWVMDLRARCFAYLGNARRVLGELRSAEDAFLKAEECLTRSTTGNFRIEAEVWDLKISLRRAQRRFEEALILADRALALYREGSETEGVWKVLINKAKILEERGDFAGALAVLGEARVEIGPQGPARLLNLGNFNLLCCLILAERFEEAEIFLPEIRLDFQGAQPLDVVRLRWAQGLIDLGLGRLGPAEAAFREVRQEFLDRQMGYDAALVSLDLARLFVQEGCVADLKQLAAELMPIFESRDVHREAMVTLLLFQRACEEERLTVDLVRSFAASLRRDRRSG